MESNDDGEGAIIIMRKFVKKAIDECNDMEILDLVYRIIVFDKTEGRADQPCLYMFVENSISIIQWYQYSNSKV